MAGRQSILIGLIAVLALTGSTGAPSATSTGRPSAKAIGIQVSAPGLGGGSAGVVTGPPGAVGVGGSFAFPADGSIAQAASVSSSVSGVSGATTTASASVEVSGLSLFGGEITVSSITARGSAKAGGGVTGEAGGSAINGAVVLGQPVGPGQTVAYGSWGTVSALQQYGTPFSSRGNTGFQTRVTGLSVHLNAAHAGAPAGTDILVGYIDVSALVPPAPPPPPPPPPPPKPKQKLKAKPPTTTTTTNAGKSTEAPTERAGPSSLVPQVREIPYNVFPKLTAGRYVFPVYGSTSYTNTFGAPRANTGWHHGEDIFAPLGAPILAVADGIVYSVGWNDIGGLRLWLQDRAGNEFYYAHLSAFSPLAVNGAQVRAGDVLAFMGNTGDAEATPYHLHFEIHPAALMYQGYDGVVAPYPYLNAWRRLQDLPLTGAVSGAVSGWAPPISDSSDAPKPGAILLQSRDISNGTGLEPGSLRRAMRPSGRALADDGSFAGIGAEGERPRARSLLLGRP